MRRWLIVIALFTTGCACRCREEAVTAPASDWPTALAARLAEVVPAALEAEDIPGAVILVGHRADGEWVSMCQAMGNLQIEPEPRPMPADAIFDLASMTKPIATGTAMMILADRGLLSVDDPVALHLSEYDTEEKRGVLIRDLMTHCSGLQSYIGEAARAPIVEQWGAPCADALQDHILNIELRHAPPASVTVYSCLNAITCAQIVERVSGQPLDVFTAENIFAPLGMTETAFSPGPGPRVVPTTPGARTEGAFLRGMVHDPLANLQEGVSGNAGLFSTAQDLSILAQMMLQGGVRGGVRILAEETVAQMTSDQLPAGVLTTSGNQSHRGLLWQVYQPDADDTGFAAIPAFGHTGYTGTAIRIWPSEDLYVIAMTNRVHPDDSGRVSAFRRLCWRTAGEVILGLETPAAGS